ncbi:MAG TPA: hypothetical protein PLI62_04155 [Spirochaetota bacterium]|nr:hypothetical protein [Spirochaetota bacterium]
MKTIPFKTKLLYFFCCTAIAVSTSACSMQEELFDLADGTNMLLAIGYDGSTTKIISLEPDLGHFHEYDTGLAMVPFPGAVAHAHGKILWFLVGSEIFKWKLEDSSTPVMVLSMGTIYVFGRSGDGNIIACFGSDVYSISEDGTYSIIGTIGAPVTFFRDVFSRRDGGGFIIDQSSGGMYTVSSGSIALYASSVFTPATSNQSFLKKVNGEFYVGTSDGFLYRDFNSNGTNFSLAITQISPLSGANSISYCVISSSLWYIAYQTATNADVVVMRYDNGVASPVISLPTTGMAHVYLCHYEGDKLVLGLGNTASAQGLYVIDAGKKSCTLLSGSYRIYGLSRVDQ